MLYTLGQLALEDPPYQHTKPLLLLSYLTLEGAQERRHLAQLFWPHSETPLNNLSAILFRLKRDIPGAIGADKTSVWSTLTSDAAAFLSAAEQGLDEQALALYGGSFLGSATLSVESPPLEEWLYSTRELLSQRAYVAALRVAEDLAKRGELALAVQQAETALSLRDIVALEPDTLGRTYRLLRLGKSPKANLLRAEAQEFDLDLSPYEPAAAQTATRVAETQHDLPLNDRSFVGRSLELAQLSAHLAKPECRLLTLLGPGGVGKSRLALELAHQHAHRDPFQDGAVLVALEALTSPELIPTRIADALGLPLTGKDDPLQRVIQRLSDQHLLLILDNFEHLTQGAASVSTLLAHCPALKVVATSRARLNLGDEWTYPVEGLRYPDLREQPGEDVLIYDAPTLFYRRAKRTRLDFELTPDDAPHLQELCRLVSGFPLALELAATWLRALPLSAITQEVKTNLDFLVSLRQDASERHQSMAAVLTQSWGRLAPDERSALAKLSMFEGGFSRDAAVEVAGASLLMLTRLLDKSLLRREVGGRYGFHPLTKQFAAQKLGQDEAMFRQTHERLSDYFLSFAERAEPELTGPEQAGWLERLEEDLDNLRVAMKFFLEREQGEKALRLMGALGNFWQIRGYFTEGRQWLKSALALTENEKIHLDTLKTRAKALRWAGSLAKYQGDYHNAQNYLEEGVAIAKAVGDTAEVAHCYSNLGTLALERGDYPAAHNYYQESLSIRQKLNDQVGIAGSLNNLGLSAYYQRDYSAAQRYYEESLSILKSAGDLDGAARTLNNLGIAAYRRRDYLAAQHYYEESLAVNQELGDQLGLAYALENLGLLAYEQSHYSVAHDYIEKSLIIERQLGRQWGIASSLENLGNIASQRGDYGIAERFYVESLAIMKRLDNEEGVVEALCSLGKLANLQRKSDDAQKYLEEALKLLDTPILEPRASRCLEEFGHLAYMLQQCRRAVRLWAGAYALRQAMDDPLPDSERARYEQNLSAVREKLGEATFRAVWDTGERLTLDEVIAYALSEQI